jgi:hypothetical protein
MPDGEVATAVHVAGVTRPDPPGIAVSVEEFSPD